MARPKEMTSLDYYLRYEGKRRTMAVHDNQSGDVDCRPTMMIDRNDMEDALIEALDAGMDSDEIADILLGSIS